jgi:hypothetical protein
MPHLPYPVRSFSRFPRLRTDLPPHLDRRIQETPGASSEPCSGTSLSHLIPDNRLTQRPRVFICSPPPSPPSPRTMPADLPPSYLRRSTPSSVRRWTCARELSRIRDEGLVALTPVSLISPVPSASALCIPPMGCTARMGTRLNDHRPFQFPPPSRVATRLAVHRSTTFCPAWQAKV